MGNGDYCVFLHENLCRTFDFKEIKGYVPKYRCTQLFLFSFQSRFGFCKSTEPFEIFVVFLMDFLMDLDVPNTMRVRVILSILIYSISVYCILYYRQHTAC